MLDHLACCHEDPTRRGVLQGSDSQMYWENPQVSAPDPNVPAANAYHAHNMRLPIEEFLMDIHPVTTAEYAAYLRETGYTPVDKYNFLKNWGGERCDTPTTLPLVSPLRTPSS